MRKIIDGRRKECRYDAVKADLWKLKIEGGRSDGWEIEKNEKLQNQ